MRSLRKFWKLIIPGIILFIVIAYALADPDISVQTVLTYTPLNPVLAAGILLALYAVKSATIVFPLTVLQIAAGLLFPAGIALLINLVGLFILLSIPYLIGHSLGIDTIDRLIRRYPKFGSVVDRQQSNSFFLSFFLRLIGELPGDVITMYLGATNTPYYQNLIGGILGLLPGMILTTILGASIQEPDSPMFWISITLRLLLSAVSFGGYYFYKRKTQSKHS